jgi:hypothetical protein
VVGGDTSTNYAILRNNTARITMQETPDISIIVTPFPRVEPRKLNQIASEHLNKLREVGATEESLKKHQRDITAAMHLLARNQVTYPYPLHELEERYIEMFDQEYVKYNPIETQPENHLPDDQAPTLVKSLLEVFRKKKTST